MTTSDPKKFAQLVERLQQKIKVELQDKLPRKVGIIAVNHFKQNFRDSGFMDGGLTPWQKSQRELRGGRRAKARYKTLTSGRNHLMSSIEAQPAPGEVSITNPVPYAAIHNEGGTLVSNPRITPQMRKFAWAMAYEAAGIRKGSGAKGKRKKGQKRPPLPPEAQKWVAMALTKKTHLRIKAKIPKRQFIGDSRELAEKVDKEIITTLEKIKRGIPTMPSH